MTSSVRDTLVLKRKKKKISELEMTKAMVNILLQIVREVRCFYIIRDIKKEIRGNR